MSICPHCHTDNQDNKALCRHCGRLLPEPTQLACVACGYALRPGAVSCARCGAPQTQASAEAGRGLGLGFGGVKNKQPKGQQPSQADIETLMVIEDRPPPADSNAQDETILVSATPPGHHVTTHFAPPLDEKTSSNRQTSRKDANVTDGGKARPRKARNRTDHGARKHGNAMERSTIVATVLVIVAFGMLAVGAYLALHRKGKAPAQPIAEISAPAQSEAMQPQPSQSSSDDAPPSEEGLASVTDGAPSSSSGPAPTQEPAPVITPQTPFITASSPVAAVSQSEPIVLNSSNHESAVKGAKNATPNAADKAVEPPKKDSASAKSSPPSSDTSAPAATQPSEQERRVRKASGKGRESLQPETNADHKRAAARKLAEESLKELLGQR